MKENFNILFAGGGTGGHLFPALAIAEEVKCLKPGVDILFIGTKHKIEERVVPQKGFRFHTIWISGFRRKFSLTNFLVPLKIIVSLLQSIALIRKNRPRVVIGTGGYVCGPVVYVASLMNIPTVIHEQNSFPGVTTRLLANKATEVHLTFETTKKYLKRTDNVFVSGNPTRPELDRPTKEEALAYFGFDVQSGKKTILVFGGSLGAATLNNALLKFIDDIVKSDTRLIWQTGKQPFAEISNEVSKYLRHEIWVSPFIERMDYAYAAADVVVCRSGATSLAELTRLGKASILIPYPYAAANHQEENAKMLVMEDAAEIVLDKNSMAELPEKIFSLLRDDERRKKMEQHCKRFAKPDAGKEIAQHILALAQ